MTNGLGWGAMKMERDKEWLAHDQLRLKSINSYGIRALSTSIELDL